MGTETIEDRNVLWSAMGISNILSTRVRLSSAMGCKISLGRKGPTGVLGKVSTATQGDLVRLSNAMGCKVSRGEQTG